MVAIEDTVFRRSGEGRGGSGGEVTVSFGVLEFRDSHENGLVSFRVGGGGGGGRESLGAAGGGANGTGGSGPCSPCKTFMAFKGTCGLLSAVNVRMISTCTEFSLE